LATLRCGVIGLGKTGLGHLKFLAGHPDCQVVAVTDKPGDALPSDVDLAVIASWDQYHAEQAAEYLERGVHVFVEKPACLTRKELEILRNIKGRRDARLSMNMVMRARVPKLDFTPYRIDASYNWGRKEKMAGWRGKVPGGYSPVLGGGIHLLDLMVALMGPLEQVESFTAEDRDGMAFVVCSTLMFERGLGTLTSDLGSPPPHRHGFHAWGRDTDWAYAGERNLPDTAVLGSFIDSILDPSKEPMVTEADVFRTMEACFLVEESWRN